MSADLTIAVAVALIACLVLGYFLHRRTIERDRARRNHAELGALYELTVTECVETLDRLRDDLAFANQRAEEWATRADELEEQLAAEKRGAILLHTGLVEAEAEVIAFRQAAGPLFAPAEGVK